MTRTSAKSENPNENWNDQRGMQVAHALSRDTLPLTSIRSICVICIAYQHKGHKGITAVNKQ